MSKCLACYNYYHPDFMLITDEVQNIKKCMFCYMDKKELTVSDEDGKPLYTVTKEEANRNYLQYLREQAARPKVKEIMAGGQADGRPKRKLR